MRPSSRDSELTRLGELLDLAPVGVIVRDFDNDTIIYWSQGAESVYGWSREEALGQVTHTLLNTRFPSSLEAVNQELRRVGRWESELVHTTRSGELITVASRQALQRDDRGEPMAILEINTDLSVHKQAAQALSESEENFRLLVDSVQDYAIFMLSPEGRVISWNQGAQRLKGYRPEEILGESFTLFYTPEDVARGLPRTLLSRAEAEGRVEQEGWRVRKDGTRFWGDVVLTALRDRSGRLRGFAKVTRDLTERMLAEEARARASREEGARAASEAAQSELRVSRDQLAAILAGVAEGIMVQEPVGKLVYTNDAGAHMCGFESAAELLSVPADQIVSRFELFDESGQPFSTDRLPGRMALRGQSVPEVLVRFRVRATGEERWSIISATPIFDALGRVRMSVAIFRDVTERKRSEDTARFLGAASAELAASLEYEDTLRRVAHLAVPTLADWCAVDVFDDEGVLRRVAAAHVDPDTVGLGEAAWTRFQGATGPDAGTAEVIRTGRSQLLATITEPQLASDSPDSPNSPNNEQLEMIRSLHLRSLIVVPMIARGRTLGAITLAAAESGRRYGPRDLTVAEDLAVRAGLAVDNARLYREAQHQAELHVELNAALRDTMAQLHQTLDTRDEFLASASHDLKNPISSIKATAQLLLHRLQRSSEINREQLAQALQRIDAVSTRAAALVDELLDVARLQMGRPLDLDRRDTDLVAVAREIVAEHQQRTERHEIRLMTDAPELHGDWDARRLGRALANLLDNALKYSPEGGLVQVQLRRAEHEPGWALVSVQDAGIGIPEADLTRIFERFQRGSNVVGAVAGTGVGLASVRQIVESHGGSISAVSAPGAGTTFTIRLPIQPDRLPEGEATASP